MFVCKLWNVVLVEDAYVVCSKMLPGNVQYSSFELTLNFITFEIKFSLLQYLLYILLIKTKYQTESDLCVDISEY